MRKIGEGLLWVWQILQNLIGLLYMFMIKKSIVNSVHTEQYSVYYKEGRGGVSLGRYIFVYKYTSPNVVLHEYGHVRQSRMLGPLYLFVIGIPSIIHAAVHNCKNYYHFYTEKWANKLAGLKADSIGRLYKIKDK